MLIAIEGIDGSGKGTQANLLVEKLHSVGRTAAIVSFPRYGKTPSSDLIARYLNGKLGPLEAVSPYQAAAIFALDRLESRPHLEALLDEYEIVVADRYVGSNMAYQAVRVPEIDRERFLTWINWLEYDVNHLPKPSVTCYLDVPPTAAVQHVAKKAARAYTSASHDLHEKDLGFQGRVQFGYRYLAESGLLGADCHAVVCADADGIVSPPATVHNLLWDKVLPYLNEF